MLQKNTKPMLSFGKFRILFFLFLFIASFSVSTIIFQNIHPTKIFAQTSPVVWPAFDGGGNRSGNFTGESVFTPSTVGGLTRLWKTSLPYTSNGAPVYAASVVTSSGTKDLLFWTTQKGSLVAIDAATGNKVWEADTSGNFVESQGTSSSPAIDPSNNYVYSYGLDGKVHKYSIGTGTEETTDNFPVTVTLHTSDEKESSPLNIGNGYLYVTTSGYNGDFGNYVGHVVAINLSTGTTTIFNSLCSNIHQLLGENDCSSLQSGIWARGGAVIDPVTNNIFVSTGNGPYGSGSNGFNYGDTIIELSPDLSQVIDTYTPSNYATLNSQDEDLGSAAPVMLPTQTNTSTPYLAVQGGKDLKVRLLNRQNISGTGGPQHTGGELQSISVSCEIHSHAPIWQDGNSVTWVFVSDICNNFYAFKVVNANNTSTLQQVYKKTGITTSGFIAGGVLFGQAANVINAFDPTTGATLWQSSQSSAGGSVGSVHWQSPIAINGRVFTADNGGNIYAYSLPNLPSPSVTTTVTPSTATGSPTPTPANSTVTLSNLSVYDTSHVSYWSLKTNLQNGNTLYGDKSYTFTNIPSSLLGSAWVQPANASKSYTSDPLFTFSIDQPATVYIAFDARETLPSWVDNSWTNTGMQLTDSEPITFNIYKKSFAAGTVTLGHNAVQQYGVDMYIAMVPPVLSQASPTPSATPTATATPTPTVTPTVTPTFTPSPTPLPTMTPTPTQSQTQLVLSNLSVKDSSNAGNWSIQSNIQSGNTLYGDRTYTISSLDTNLAGTNWIRTANGSKSYTSDPTVTFSINKTATVYVGFDTRATKPSWVDSSWTNSGYQMTDSEPVTFLFYQKTFSAGTVSLGHNATQTSGVNMYTIVVK